MAGKSEEQTKNDLLQSRPHSNTDPDVARLRELCYEAMPMSNKIVVFDLRLNLRKAFCGLIYQSTRHVLLSDASQNGSIVGILSVTDFIRVMLRFHRERKLLEKKHGHLKEASSDNSFLSEKHQKRSTDGTQGAKTDIGSFTIQEYRELIKAEGRELRLITVDANQTLLEAARVLKEHRIHRLPVLDPAKGSPLFILTYKRLLKFIWCFGQQFSRPEYHIKSAKELGVGTWCGIRVVFPDTPLVDCLDILLNKGVSGLPVVERGTYKVVDMYSRFDAVGIALEERANSLDVTVKEALEFKNLMKVVGTSNVVSVLHTDSLWKAIMVFVERNVHRLVAVDEKGCIEGVISLSDIISHLVVEPGATMHPATPVRRNTVKAVGELSGSELKEMLHESAHWLEVDARKSASSLKE